MLALGLVFACMKKIKGAWGAGAQGINYCADATTLVNAIYNREIEQAGPAPTMVSGASNGINSTDANQLIPGDQWGSEPAGGLVNLSYFAPGWYTVFGKFMDSAHHRALSRAPFWAPRAGQCAAARAPDVLRHRRDRLRSDKQLLRR